jgi:four helix bundle protein
MDFTDNPRYKENIILRLTFEYAVEIVKYAEELERKRKFSIANQVLRPGTSFGANTREAQNAESKQDFIHKIKIALKEADELEYWLFLCNEIKTYPSSN